LSWGAVGCAPIRRCRRCGRAAVALTRGPRSQRAARELFCRLAVAAGRLVACASGPPPRTVAATPGHCCRTCTLAAPMPRVS